MAGTTIHELSQFILVVLLVLPFQAVQLLTGLRHQPIMVELPSQLIQTKLTRTLTVLRFGQILLQPIKTKVEHNRLQQLKRKIRKHKLVSGYEEEAL